ncbi:MAG: hypothetical protein HGA70_06600 [Chlorobiaceae bacterium]|nr:hypothetical protein [Chlorobiaceae bacterium]
MMKIPVFLDKFSMTKGLPLPELLSQSSFAGAKNLTVKAGSMDNTICVPGGLHEKRGPEIAKFTTFQAEVDFFTITDGS